MSRTLSSAAVVIDALRVNHGTCSTFLYAVLTFFMLLLSSAVFIHFRNTIKVSNGLNIDQDRHFVGPDLGPDCLV